GMTAVLSIDSSRRDHVARIPNGALSFTPTPEVLRASGVTQAAAPDVTAHDDSNRGRGSSTRAARVWEYDGAQFTPVSIETGLADDGWTELVKGPIGPGIALVTHAQVAH